MRTVFNKTIPVILLLVLAFSCKKAETVFEYDQVSPQLSFVVSQIQKSLADQAGIDAEYKLIIFEQNQTVGADEGYSIEIDERRLIIRANDENGLMYGGLEVAEQLQLSGQVRNTSHTPYMKKRGIKMNFPLDARTPSYDDTGDAAQQNILSMWDWNFWQEYLDQLAINRYNVLTLWNPHPFPSMIKMESYPDVALNDVCVTTLKPTGKENEWAEPQMVSSNVLENLQVVKEISIEDKIAFWQKVMQYAHDRGIEIYFFTWNICPNSAANPVYPFYKTTRIDLANETPGKNGITNQMENPVTVRYYREAVKTFLLTYPNVKGIGVTAGEHMMNKAGNYTREQWIWEAYGQGILDATKENPERKVDFIHRVWNTNMDKIFDYWKDYPHSFEASFKYARARLYSTPTPDFAVGHMEAMKKYELKSWWNLRNDDIFVHRWGNPDYVRAFINHFDLEHTAGFYMGSDGYVWAREFNSKNPELAGQLEITKHWYKFMLWGRLAYNNKLTPDFFIAKIHQHYPGTDAAKLYEAWKTASEIIPAVNRFHWNDWDYQWAVEACIDTRNGFHDVNRFITNPTLAESNILNPADYAESVYKDEELTGISPFHAADEISGFVSKTQEMVKELRNTQNSAELNALLDDMQSMSFLGLYYAGKIEAATELALFRKTENVEHQHKAAALLEDCIEHWKHYAKIMDKNYKPQMLARTGNFDVHEILEEVEEDVIKAMNFNP